MKTYLVGGAVRERLLGLPRGDRDFVVVGGTPASMLAVGFRPVGADGRGTRSHALQEVRLPGADCL